jgi:hypothetical protein
MATPATKPTETPKAPAFVSTPLSALPKRAGPQAEPVDLEAANALLAIVSAPATAEGDAQTASDGVEYPDAKAARGAVNKARRLLGHVTLPAGKVIKTRVYKANSGQSVWALWLAEPDAETPEAVAEGDESETEAAEATA